MKILHTADVHLREEGDKRWEALQKLIAAAKKEGAEILAISGDLFDKGANAEALRPKIRDIFSNNGFKIVLIPGNHDLDAYQKGMYFGDDTVILSELDDPFTYQDIRIWGLPFAPKTGSALLEELHRLKDKLTADKINVLLYHGELLDAFFARQAFGEEGEERYMPLKLSYFKDLNFTYILGGHFHSNFDIRKLENESGGYFVYPGSPVSITKKETGRRKVNLLEPGNPPQEYVLDTFHFEEIKIELDPFSPQDPLATIKEKIEDLPEEASLLLTVGGYIDSAQTASEEELVRQIREIAGEKTAEEHLEFKDIHTILEDSLFQSFIHKLEERNYDEEKKKELRELAIKAMMGARG